MDTLEAAIQASPNANHRGRVSRSLRARLLSSATIAAPIAGLSVGAWLAARSRRGRRAGGWAVMGGSIALAVARWQLARLLVEQAPYEVEMRAGDLEVRRYAPSVRAETVVEGATWAEALTEGFRRVAAYIFGDNDRASRIAMTAPVESTLPAGSHEAESERIAMTAPVIASIGSPGADRTIAFVMPHDRPLATLPRPKDPRVHLREVPERRVAALRFRGGYRGGLPASKRAELFQRVREAGLAAQGEATFAGYDPPSTLPWLRRNEVMVEVL